MLLDAVHLYRVYRQLDTLPLYLYYELLLVLKAVIFQYEKLFKYYHMEISSNDQAMNMYPIKLMLKEQCVDIAMASIMQSMTFCCDQL